MKYADDMERAVIWTIESGKMTKDLANITSIENVIVLNTEQFISAVKAKYDDIT
jgi:isocitrate dehydrogenase